MTINLCDLMATPLPTKSEQRRMPYRPTKREANRIYDLINQEIFKGQLRRPEIQLGRIHNAWGWCAGNITPLKSGSYCTIKVSDKWFCVQWFIITLAHEMAHQYQWDILGPKRAQQGKDFLMSHGPSFFQHRKRLSKYDIPLKTALRTKRWFKHQNFKYC